MTDLRRTLLFLYIVYVIPSPCLFTFLLFKYHQFSSVLLSLTIGNFIFALILFFTVFLLRNDKKRFWIFIIFLFALVTSTFSILWVIYHVFNRIHHDFKSIRTVFREAIDRQVSTSFSRRIDRNFVFVQIQYVSEPTNSIWGIIMIKQCCGIDSNQIDSSSKEFRWFRQTPIRMFCPEIPIDRNLIETFEKASQMTFAPRGPCLRAIENELKLELISASIIVGFAVFILLFTWLFFYQNSTKYSNLFKLKRKTAQRQSSKKHSSILSATSEAALAEISLPKQFETPILGEKSMPIVTKTVANKKDYKGFMRLSDDLRD